MSKEKKYTIFWRTGETQIVTGNKPHEAMNNAGIGAGALGAMDFYGEGADVEKLWEYDKEARSWKKKPEEGNE